jgi:hypothetical protein
LLQFLNEKIKKVRFRTCSSVDINGNNILRPTTVARKMDIVDTMSEFFLFKGLAICSFEMKEINFLIFFCVEKFRRAEGKEEKGVEERHCIQDKIPSR